MLSSTVWVFIGVYVAMSGLAMYLYGKDKAAAIKGERRVPENLLHLVSVLGGWPGALIAQRKFRHKTVKQPFRTIFWGTVVVNVVVFGWVLITFPTLFG